MSKRKNNANANEKERAMKKGKKRDLRYEAMTKRSQADDAIREALKLVLEGTQEEALNMLKGAGPETPMSIVENIVSQAVRMGFNNALNIRQGASYSSF